VENWCNCQADSQFGRLLSCKKPAPNSAWGNLYSGSAKQCILVFHNFHIQLTGVLKEDWTVAWKSAS
jgi:hypothetical protein